ncbi:MAG: hypothetical protein HY869_15775 [Chloroflexi bacterium]|nr:hypothetical protein [Chloroflexota bacterium]
MPKIKYAGFLLLIVFVAACSPAAVTQEAPPVPTETAVVEPSPTETDYMASGTYATQTFDNGAVCMLEIKGEPDLKFLVNCNRGAPSYNMGIISGNFEVVEPNIGLFKTSDFGNCELRFEFNETGVNVTQTGADFECGFGNGVTANGAYTFQNNETPDIP